MGRHLAFVAPLKPPDHPRPSGDRSIARLLIAALRRAGHRVELVARLRSRDGDGDPARQRRLIALGERWAARALRRWQCAGERPDAVFCYHSYYKAPDLIGPALARALDCPYWVAEASWAPRRAQGRWAPYHAALAAGLRRADGVICLNPRDAVALPAVLAPGCTLASLAPFVDLDALLADWAPDLARAPAQPPRLVALAMFRPGDKLRSLALLARALHQLDRPHRLRLIGDGAARAEVEALFADHRAVEWCGQLRGAALRRALGACDVMVWPALNEAIGMALLEAQSCGVPVLAGREGGTAAVVHHGLSGELCPPRDPAAFAAALRRLLDAPALLARYRRATLDTVRRHHHIDAAAAQLDALLRGTPPTRSQPPP